MVGGVIVLLCVEMASVIANAIAMRIVKVAGILVAFVRVVFGI